MPGEPATSAWLEQQMERALERIDALTREVAHAQTALAAREQEVEALRQSLTILDGRTRRQEAAVDAVPDLRRMLADLDERVAAEAALRRDQSTSAERGRERESGEAHLLERDVIALDTRLAAVEQALRAAVERETHHEATLTSTLQAQRSAEDRLDALQAQAAALADSARQEAGDGGAAREAIDDVRLHVGAVEARTDVMLRDMQQLKDELLVVRRTLDRETAVGDLVEQVRALRLRVEEGLAGLGQRIDAQQATGAVETEAHVVVRARVVALDQAVAALAARVEAQRLVLLDHFQRVTASAEDAGRRQTEEIDRQVRAARELLVRLAESADEATREQPL